MIDAGLSCKELERRLSLFGVEPPQIEAIVLTHEHTDHVRGARRFSASFGVPVYGTRGTLALSSLDGIETVPFPTSRPFAVAQILFRPFRVKHLAAEPVAFSVGLGSKRVGIASDLGCITSSVVDEMVDSDLLLIEANYDEDMLLSGDYPGFLKRAIRGDHGHLSNEDAGTLSRRTATERTEKVVLVHLSRENNTPEKARDTVDRHLRDAKKTAKVEVTEHGAAKGPFRLR